jgi:hypothetical protein
MYAAIVIKPMKFIIGTPRVNAIRPGKQNM